MTNKILFQLIAITCLIADYGSISVSAYEPPGWHVQQEESVLSSPDETEFSIKGITGKLLYKSKSYSVIQANGVEYLAFEEKPQPVLNAMIIETEGNTVKWIVVYKAGSTDLPKRLDEFEPQKFLFEHSGAGVYHVQTVDSNGLPVFDQFTVVDEDDPPPDPTDPVTPPGSHAELIAIVSTAMPANDDRTRIALQSAYAGSVLSITDSMQLTQAYNVVESARIRAMMGLPFFQDGRWNTFLLQVKNYLAKQKTVGDYRSALTVLAAEMLKPKTTILQSAPVRQSIPVQYYYPNTYCPDGTCPPVLFRR